MMVDPIRKEGGQIVQVREVTDPKTDQLMLLLSEGGNSGPNIDRFQVKKGTTVHFQSAASFWLHGFSLRTGDQTGQSKPAPFSIPNGGKGTQDGTGTGAKYVSEQMGGGGRAGYKLTAQFQTADGFAGDYEYHVNINNHDYDPEMDVEC